MTLQQAKACLDAEVRKLLSQKIILAWILRRNAREFSGMELPAIMDCIEGEPEIGIRPVNPGETNIAVQDPAGPQITGMQNENTVPGEGQLYYDIIFYVKIPRKHDIIKMIINVEAQKSFYPGYRIETRGIFYAAREISAQKNTEFWNSDYDRIKKVYSIWLCMNAPNKIGNAIAEYSFEKKDILPGIPDRREAYDKMTVVLVTLNQKTESRDPFINLMNTLTSTRTSAAEKKKRLEEEFGIEVSREMEGGINTMCNYSDLIEQEGIEKGIEKGIKQGIEQGIEKGKILVYREFGLSPGEIACRMGLSEDQIQRILEEDKALAPV